jgi:sulfofructose kinase
LSRAFDVLGIGLNATDTLLLVQEFPPYAGKVAFDRELLSPGGQVASAVVACARLGLRAKYIGTIGDDLRGTVQRQSLEGTGVDTTGLIVRKDCPNQTAYIIIDERNGERTVLWQRGACLRLDPSEINEQDIASARMLHIDGYDVEAAAHAASLAHKNGIPVSLDVDTLYPGFESVLKNVDYLVASSTWPAKWTQETDPFTALTLLQKEYGFAVAAMTLGDQGSLALQDGAWFYSPAFEVSCVDTTGAGDVFHGAFCYAMLSGKPMQKVLEFSNAAAALNCKAIGARGHIPLRAEVESLIKGSAAGQIHRRINLDVEARVAAGVPAAHK